MAAVRPLASGVASHEWVDARRLVMQDLGAVEQIQCKHCGRDFIIVLSNNAIQAVAIEMFSFWILASEVSERWINYCPGGRLANDEYDRMKRVREVTF